MASSGSVSGTTETRNPVTGASSSDIPPAKSRPSNKELDSQWADLQATLADVELSSGFGGGASGQDASGIGRAHVFGPGHASVLEELRSAQIELAKAWGPGPEPADTEGKGKGGEKGKDGGKGKTGDAEKRPETAGSRTTHASTAASNAAGVAGAEAADLSNASARREANEKYFADVKAGVEDVVSRLDAVAAAMRKVEAESREIWGDGDSMVSAGTGGE